MVRVFRSNFLFVNKRTHKHTRAFVVLRKRTGSAKIVIAGMDDENDTKKKKRLVSLDLPSLNKT